MPAKPTKEEQLNFARYFQAWIYLLQKYKTTDKTKKPLSIEQYFASKGKPMPAMVRHITTVEKDRASLSALRNHKRVIFFRVRKERDPNMIALKRLLGELEEKYYGRSVDPKKDPEGYEQHRREIALILNNIKTRCNAYLQTHQGFRWTFTGRYRQRAVREALRISENIMDSLKLTAQDFAASTELAELVGEKLDPGIPPEAPETVNDPPQVQPEPIQVQLEQDGKIDPNPYFKEIDKLAAEYDAFDITLSDYKIKYPLDFYNTWKEKRNELTGEREFTSYQELRDYCSGGLDRLALLRRDVEDCYDEDEPLQAEEIRHIEIAETARFLDSMMAKQIPCGSFEYKKNLLARKMIFAELYDRAAKGITEDSDSMAFNVGVFSSNLAESKEFNDYISGKDLDVLLAQDKSLLNFDHTGLGVTLDPEERLLASYREIETSNPKLGLRLYSAPKEFPLFMKELAANCNDNTPELSSIKESLGRLFKDADPFSVFKQDYFPDNLGGEDILRHRNVYDALADKIYRNISVYVEKNKAGLSDPDSFVSKLAAFKGKMFAEGTLPAEIPQDAIVINASSNSKYNGSLNFRGDDELAAIEQLRLINTDQQYDPKRDKPVIMQSYKDEALFPHDPYFSDIKQGNVGDCYFQAYMASLSKTDPKAIKDMIRDNGDGTVTCRFFNDQGQKVFVTVDKTIPVHNNDSGIEPSNKSESPLWFSCIEKAYMMSGLKPLDHDKEYDNLIKAYRLRHPKIKSDEDAKKGIFAEAHKKDKNAPQYSEEAFDRLVQHSNVGIYGGHQSELSRALTGKISFVYSFNKPDFESFSYNLGRPWYDSGKDLALLSDFEEGLDEDQKDLMHTIRSRAAINLKENAVEFKINADKKKYASHKALFVEDIVKSMRQVLEDKELMYSFAHPKFSAEKPFTEQEVRDLTERYIKSFETFQLNNKGEAKVIPFKTEGKYSTYANDMFSYVKDNLAEKKLLQVSMGKHAYSVLWTREYNGKKYVTLRNPWGEHGFSEQDKNAKFNDLSGLSKANKGVFELELNQFVGKIKSIECVENSKVLNKDSVSELLAKQYIETIYNYYGEHAVKLFKGKKPDDPTLIADIKGAEKIQALADACLDSDEKMYSLETSRRIGSDEFAEFIGLDKTKLKLAQEKFKFKEEIQNAKPGLFNRVTRPDNKGSKSFDLKDPGNNRVL